MLFLRPFQDLMAAVMFLSRLPVPVRWAGPYKAVSKYCWAFPFVGAVVGFISGLVLWLALSLGLAPVIASLLAVMAAAFVTGALHEDGLGDVMDGFWGGMEPVRRLEIMRDSQIGTYGTLSLIGITGLKVFALTQIIETGILSINLVYLMIILHVLTRSVLPMVMLFLPLASKKGLAASAGKASWVQAFIALILGGVSAYGFYIYVLSVSISGLLVLYIGLGALVVLFSWLVMRKLGGYNGDCLGALEQLGEALILMILAASL